MQIVQSYPYPGSVNTAALADSSVTYAKLDILSIFGGNKMQLVTASGTVTIPTNTSRAWVRMVGGGGGGGGGSASGSGGGGAAGDYAEQFFTGLTPGNTLTATIGALGAAGAADTDGSAGGSTSLASGTQTITTCSVGGGPAGKSATNGAQGGASSNTISGAEFSMPGARGGWGYSTNLVNPGAGGSSPLGIAPPAGFSGGSFDGLGYGSGGSGSGGNGVAGSGTAGCIVIVWLA